MLLGYVEAPDVKRLVDEVVEVLGFSHVIPQRVHCCRSRGTKSKRIVARIHGLGRIWQKTLRQPPTYIIEVISERYDKLSEQEKEETLIHELLHIPKGFSGGFRPHRGYISRRQVESFHRALMERRSVRTGAFM